MKHTVSEIALANNAKGLLVHVPDASVMSFEFNFRAGEYLVAPKKWEVPHLMEHMLLGANEIYPKSKLFQAEMEKNGAYSNASTGVYDIIYEAECADLEWQRVLGLMLTAVAKPLFLEEEFKAEYGNVREELASRSNDHFRQLSLSVRQKTGFLAKTDKERLKLMKNITLADVRAHYERTHTTTNLRFVIAGNITPTRQRQIKRMLSHIELPRGRSRFGLPSENPVRLNNPLKVRRSVDNIYIYIDTLLKRRLSDEEDDALGMANTILTGSLHSKILGTARERGLLYHMSSGVTLSKRATSWGFGAQLSAENVTPLFEIIVSELQKLLGGELSNEDLEAAKQYALGRFQLGAQTVFGTASAYSSRYFFDEVVDDYYRTPERIKAINQAAIINTVQEMFAQRLWAFGALGRTPKEDLEELQDMLGVLWA